MRPDSGAAWTAIGARTGCGEVDSASAPDHWVLRGSPGVKRAMFERPLRNCAGTPPPYCTVKLVPALEDSPGGTFAVAATRYVPV